LAEASVQSAFCGGCADAFFFGLRLDDALDQMSAPTRAREKNLKKTLRFQNSIFPTIVHRVGRCSD
jgi:hypothetical protein